MLCMGSKLLTIKGRNTEMTAKSLCLLLSKYFMTKQKIIKAVAGKKETCLITWWWKDAMESVSGKSHAYRHLEFWMEASTRLSSIRQKPGMLGLFYGADGIKRHSVRVGRCWTHDSAWLYVTIDAKIKEICQSKHSTHLPFPLKIFNVLVFLPKNNDSSSHLLCFPIWIKWWTIFTFLPPKWNKGRKKLECLDMNFGVQMEV